HTSFSRDWSSDVLFRSILTANDFIDPGNSAAFADLKAIPSLARDTTNLASICTAPVKSVPTLEDFLAAKNIPAAAIIIRTPAAEIGSASCRERAGDDGR